MAQDEASAHGPDLTQGVAFDELQDGDLLLAMLPASRSFWRAGAPKSLL